jgi:Leucine-rich repeat (LRR) protein
VLDLSHNNISGVVPYCLLGGANSLGVLKLKDNKLWGTLPQDISEECGFRTISLSGNRINGSLPRSLANCNTLEVLDLGKNLIVDAFPYWLQNLENLKILVLRSNQSFGAILNRKTNQLSEGSFFPMLKILDISSNFLNGPLPKEFFNHMKAMKASSSTSTLTVGYQYLVFDSEFYQNSVTVTFRGLDVDLENSLGIFSPLDSSNNGFWGDIPNEIGQFKCLDLLNLSHNALTGPIPSMFVNLEQLESVDLSFNKLVGHIPAELTTLAILFVLNISYNNLVGKVPQARHFSTFSSNSFLENPKLCGTPLLVKC